MSQKLTNLSVEYAEFLHKLRKPNGDKLLPATIERYVENFNPYSQKFAECESVDELIEFMNNEIRRRRSIVVYSAFRNYLIFLGYQPEKHDDVFMKLKTPPRTANAFSSKRFIQSKVLSRIELKKVFYSCKQDWKKMIFSVLYDTACRRAELLKIKMKDITFKKKAKDTDDISKGVYANVILHGKGGKSRTVCLSRLTVQLIERLYPDASDDDNLVVFRKPNGDLYKSQSQALYRLIVEQTSKALNRHVHPHCFRHTCLTHLADNGATALGIMAYAGHEDIKTSQIYIEISSYMGTRTYANFSQPIIDEDEI